MSFYNEVFGKYEFYILDLNSCDESPCFNNGTCIQEPDGLFSCVCEEFFEGDLCEISIDPCLEQKCSGHGVCTAISVDDYICLCESKFWH